MNRQARQGRQGGPLHPERGESDPDAVASAIVDSAIKVHRALGPGLLESAYHQCLAHELRLRGFCVDSEVPLPVRYEGLRVDAGYRVDMIVDRAVLVENKAVERLLPIHEAQLLTYMRLSGIALGFLLNWNVRLMKTGIRRMVCSNVDAAIAHASVTL